MTGRRIGLFGGAFDPPHLGHQALSLHVLATQNIDVLWWLPAPVHAFAKEMASFADRVAMCKLAQACFDRNRVSVCELERDLPPPQYSVDTVRHLVEKYPGDRFFWVIGSDNLDSLHLWKEPEVLKRLAPFIVLPRAGHHEAALLPQVSSTDLRAALAQGQAPGERLDRAVAHYIEKHGLYGEPRSERKR